MNIPSYSSNLRNSPRNQRTIVFKIILVLVFVISLLGVQPAATVYAVPTLPMLAQSIGVNAPVSPNLPIFSWAAYNDTYLGAGEPNTNITNVSLGTLSRNNALKKFGDGQTIPGIAFDVTVSNVSVNNDWGGEANTSTDAYKTFHEIAQLIGSVGFGSNLSTVTLTFFGLDPQKTYSFATTANRNGSSSDDLRITRFTLGGFDSATNLSSIGTTILSTNAPYDTTTFSTGNNSINGYIARWVGIRPGSDGVFTLIAGNVDTNNRGYGPSVFMLAEETAPTCQTANLVAMEDTSLIANFPLANYGNSTSLQVSNGIDNFSQTSLLKWDLGSIPSNVTVSSARISVFVTNTSNIAYSLYRLNRPWVEGTNDGAEGTGASWTYAGAGMDLWEAAGASDPTIDHNDRNLWDSTITSFSLINKIVIIGLNVNGVTVINEWIRGMTVNDGLIIQTYGGTVSDLTIASSEATIPANRPMLTIAYCEPTGVELNYFRAARASGGVQLTWETVSEATLAGFNLYRRELDGKFEKLNPELILPERGGQPEGYAYTYLDETAALDQRYEYRLEAIETSLEVGYSNLVDYWPYSLQLPMIQH